MNMKSKIVSNMIAGILIGAISLLTSCTTMAFPMTLCHANDDTTIPYTAITVNNTDELLAHRNDTNDIFPMPVGGCPTALVDINNEKITICHSTGSTKNPYNEIIVSVRGLNGHDKHEGDIIPMPDGGCPTALVDSNNGKITICHATGSTKNPYIEITVSEQGLNGHDKHEGDIIPMPDGGCPQTNGKTPKQK